MADIDPWEEGSRTRLNADFVSGMKCLKNNDWEGALELFRSAEKSADIDDIYLSRYTSFQGLARVNMGDKSGVKLCRKAAVGEQSDAEVYYNLAMAENKLGFRESASMALRRGLKIDAGHPGLKSLKEDMDLRERRGLLPGAGRESFISRVFGGLFRRNRRP